MIGNISGYIDGQEREKRIKKNWEHKCKPIKPISCGVVHVSFFCLHTQVCCFVSFFLCCRLFLMSSCFLKVGKTNIGNINWRIIKQIYKDLMAFILWPLVCFILFYLILIINCVFLVLILKLVWLSLESLEVLYGIVLVEICPLSVFCGVVHIQIPSSQIPKYLITLTSLYSVTLHYTMTHLVAFYDARKGQTVISILFFHKSQGNPFNIVR